MRLAFAGIIWFVIKVWESIDDLTREDERKRLAYERWYRSLPLEQQYLLDQQERQRRSRPQRARHPVRPVLGWGRMVRGSHRVHWVFLMPEEQKKILRR
jgi:hypothetical protein